MKRTLIFITLVACGGSSEAPIEEVTYGDDTVVEGQSDLQKLHELFDAEMSALRNVDAAAMLATHALDADSFMLGPVDVAVMVGGDAVRATVERVLGSAQPTEVNATEHVFEVSNDAAYSAHTVVVGPAATPEATYHAVQVYRKTAEGWRVAASSWTIAVPNERSVQMAASGALPASAPIPERLDEGCETLAQDLGGLRNDVMPPADRLVGSLTMGTAPEEVAPFTQEQYDAIAEAIGSDAVQSAAGPGAVLAQRFGDVCFGVTAMNRTFQHEGNPVTLRLRAFVVSDLRVPTHSIGSFSVVLPQRGPEAEPTEEVEQDDPTEETE